MERGNERCRRTEQDNRPTLLSQNERKITGIVAQPVTLLVRRLMLFINDQYPQIPDRSENGGPGSSYLSALARPLSSTAIPHDKRLRQRSSSCGRRPFCGSGTRAFLPLSRSNEMAWR